MTGDIVHNDTTQIVSLLCPFPAVSNEKSGKRSHVLNSETFDWDQTEQGLILSSFYYGVIITQIPAGRLSELFGGKWLVAFAVFSSGLINILTPWMARYLGLLVASRIILGLVQGVVYPAIFHMVVIWMAPNERSFGFGLVHVGGNLGAMIASAVTGYVSHEIGWKYSFIILGTFACVWTLLWIYLMRDPKGDEKLLTEADENRIKVDKVQKKTSVPWFKILSNPAVLAAVVARFSASFAYLTLQTKIPGYLKEILHVTDTTVRNVSIKQS